MKDLSIAETCQIKKHIFEQPKGVINQRVLYGNKTQLFLNLKAQNNSKIKFGREKWAREQMNNGIMPIDSNPKEGKGLFIRKVKYQVK